MKHPTPASLRALRKTKGATVRDVAAASRKVDPNGKGFTYATLSRWENRKLRPTKENRTLWYQALQELAS